MAITAPPAARTVTLSIDGRELTVPEGTTIYDAAKGAAIEIPVLCHDERYDPGRPPDQTTPAGDNSS